jgi:hypothetical protein
MKNSIDTIRIRTFKFIILLLEKIIRTGGQKHKTEIKALFWFII